MSNQIAVGQCSTEEDLDIEWSFVSGYDPTGKAFEVNLRDRSSSTVRTTLTVGSGLTIVGAAVKAKVAKATMAAWSRTEYSADLVDKTGGAFRRIVPTRFIFDEPGKLVGGAGSNSFQITQADNRFVITATRGETGPVGPATTLTIGTVTDLAAGNVPTATLTGPAGAQVLSLGLVRGTPGAGAANSADILAIGEKGRLERALAAAGVPGEPSLILDFVRGVHFASKGAIAASIMTLIAALPGSSFTRASTGTYFDSDGLLKTAALNVPRIEYDPVSRLPLGFLAEAAVTNLLTYSEQFDNAAWTKVRASVSANAIIAPDGTATADKVVEDNTATSSHVLLRSISFTSASTYTLSWFLKAGERTQALLALPATAFPASNVLFDLAAGTIAATSGATIPCGINPAGNGWHRCWATVTATSTASAGVEIRPCLASSSVYTGDGVSGFYIWGGQCEVAPFPSSYVPTAASTVTRSADVITLAYPFGTEGTLLAETDGPGGGIYVDVRLGLTAADYFLIRRDQAGQIRQYSVVANTAVINAQVLGSAGVSGLAGRVAAAFKAGDYAGSVNGAAVVANAAASVSANLNALVFSLPAGTSSHIRRVMTFPQRLSNAGLQILSNLTAWS